MRSKHLYLIIIGSAILCEALIAFHHSRARTVAAAASAGVPGDIALANDVLLSNNGNLDMGSAIRGEVLVADSQVSNNSKETVEVTVGTPSCGCTVAVLSKTLLAPKESTVIRCKVDTALRTGSFTVQVPIYTTRGFDAAGNLRRSARLLRIIAKIDPSLGLEAPLNFGEVRQGNGIVTSLPFRVAFRNSKIQLISTSWSDSVSYLFCKNVRVVSEEGMASIIGQVCVNIDAAPANGLNFQSKLLLSVSVDSSTRQIVLPVIGFIINAVRADPMILYWDRSQSESTRTVTFDAVGDKTLDIKNVVARDAGVVVWSIRDNDTSRPKLTVQRAKTSTGDPIMRTELNVDITEHGGDKIWVIRIPILSL